MKQLLQIELKRYFNTINNRSHFISKELEKSNFNNDNFEKEIEEKISKIAIDVLKAKTFNLLMMVVAMEIDLVMVI